METQTTSEKLNIAPERILPILLKHLMLLKNENAYVKKLIQIKDAENGISETDNSTNNVNNSTSKIDNSTNNVRYSIAENNNGTNDIIYSTSEIDNSTNDVRYSITENDNGTNDIIYSTSEIDNSTNDVRYSITENDNGTNDIIYSTSENDNGTNSIFSAIAQMDEQSAKGNLIYVLFEKGLMKAMDEYIQNAGGNYTLYSFYSDFLKAINNKNAADEKKEQAKKILSITDTHILPAQITIDSIAQKRLKAALRKHLVARTKREMYNSLANELLLLHNKGKTTSPELRNITGMSTDGFKKHLANIQRLNFIRKQPPLNYVLTEYSKRILLEVFGVRKGDA